MPKAQSRWHHLYCTTMWRKRAKHQLRSQPLCEMCLKDGRINAATIADHIEPHKGDEQKFFFGELQSLCKLHRREPRLFHTDRRRRLASGPKASRVFEALGGMKFF
jgi:HNH endonuclease